MKKVFLTLFIINTFLCDLAFSIRPPKEGVKIDQRLIEEFKIIQQSYSSGYWAEKMIERYKQMQDDPEILKNNLTIDSIYAPTLLGYFTDILPTYTKDQFQAQLWDGPNPSGTITDYYKEISYGKMHLYGNCEGWYPVQGPVSAYNPGSSSGGPKFTYELLVASDNQVDYSKYVRYIDAQGNGHVPFLIVVHTGGDAAAGAPNIWSHRWDFKVYSGSAFVTNDKMPDGKSVIVDGPYAIQPEMTGNQNSGGAIEPIGVFVHELGHIFNLPDLYDVSGQGEGLGGWCLMASGSYGGDQRNSHKPSHMSAWCKIKLGWVSPVNVTTTFDNFAVLPVENNPIVYRLWKNGIQGSQYFLIENRQKIGFDVSLIESGLLIYHVDDQINSQNNPDHYKVDLEQADGIRHLNLGSNRGDAGDPFPGFGGANNPNTTFDGYSTPNSRDYNNLLTGININSIRKIDTLIMLNMTIWDTSIVASAFDDVTPQVLKDSSENYGVAIFDFNNDGLEDIYVASKSTNKFYINNGGVSFTESAFSAGIADVDQNRAAVVADIDNDNFEDLLITTYNPLPLLRRKNKLYRNNSDGTFTLLTSSPVYYDDRSMGANFVDYNNDGLIDIFILSELNTKKASLFKNLGSGIYSLDTTSGLDYQGKASMAIWGDINNDGYMDVYILTRDELSACELYKNNGDGTFSNITTMAGVENMNYALGAAFGDINNDGYLDIFVCNENAPNRLYKNNQNETFTDIATIAGVADIGTNYSPVFLDYDLDGYLDIYVTRAGPNRLFRNNGNETFIEIAGRMNISNRTLNKGAAILDVNNDGLPDIFVASGSTTSSNLLYQHTTTNKKWVKVSLKGNPSNRSAIGARINCYTGGNLQIREINGGSGYLSQNSKTQFFGFQDYEFIDSMSIRFPSGNTFKFYNLSTNKHYNFIENELSAEEISTIPQNYTLYQNYPNPFNSNTIITFDVPNSERVILTVFNVLGQEVSKLVNSELKVGNYKIEFDAANLPTGVYFYRLTTQNFSYVRKMLLVR